MPGYMPDELLGILTPHFMGRIALLIYRDEKAQNTDGGNFVQAAWRTRDLTVETLDTGRFGILAANQITLQSGIYLVQASAPTFKTNGHQARWANVTDSIYIYGTSEISDAGTSNQTRSFVTGYFSITSPKVFELQHQCNTTRNADGFGMAANIATEVYSEVFLVKMA